jgi:hypothetical protein
MEPNWSKVQKILANPTEPWRAIIHHERRCQRKKKWSKTPKIKPGAERPKAKSTVSPPTGEHPKTQCKRSIEITNTPEEQP